jgi:predicted SAM-dependent methyltransferase
VSVQIDIGGGTNVKAGFTNLDPVHGHGDFKRRVQDGIPFPDSSVDAVHASHLVEHIHAGTERINLFNEVHRVLRPGGTFEVIVPFLTVSNGQVRWEAIADPTHVSYWLTESFHYFDGTKFPCATYNIRLWTTKLLETRGGWEGHWIGTPRK